MLTIIISLILIIGLVVVLLGDIGARRLLMA